MEFILFKNNHNMIVSNFKQTNIFIFNNVKVKIKK